MSRARRLLGVASCALALLALPLSLAAQSQVAPSADNDQTLRAMRDEMRRSRDRLKLPSQDPPYYLEFRLLDIEQRSIVATFGALLNSTTSRNRFMDVNVRVGDYLLDSSNFISDEGFRGFIGSTGSVGIDGDYDSLRQDLWLATDQAYKESLDQFSRKRAYLMSLARPSDIPDFSRQQPVVLLDPKVAADWTSRDWETEARQVSAALRAFPELYASRVTYHLVHMTYYLLTSEGTEIRVTRSLAAIEAGLDTQADDGMRLHHFYSSYANRPAELPPASAVRKDLDRVGRELLALRASPLATDYVGPVLFEPAATGSLLAQMLGPSVSGARAPLAMGTVFDQIMDRMGGRSEWNGRLNTRVFPAGISLVGDPTQKDFQGQPLLGWFAVDDEGVRAQRVPLVDNGILKNLLMSRRPGADFQQSNGHGRGSYLSEPRAAMANVFFQSSDGKSKEELRKQFADLCRQANREWCVVIRQMDNPALAFQRQDDFSDVIGAVAGGAANGDRLPLLVYRVNVADGREELMRGATLTGMKLRSLRNIAGIGNDYRAFQYMQSQAPGFAGTALSAFGSAQGGVPTSVVAPSLLLEEVEVRGARGEPRRAPLLPAPPLN